MRCNTTKGGNKMIAGCNVFWNKYYMKRQIWWTQPRGRGEPHEYGCLICCIMFCMFIFFLQNDEVIQRLIDAKGY